MEELLNKILGEDKRTTIAGIIAAIGLVCANLGTIATNVGYMFDGDTTTSANFSVIAGLAVAIGGIFGIGKAAKQEKKPDATE